MNKAIPKSIEDMNVNEIKIHLWEFMNNEAISCSMDFGCVTPLYVYRMWGGSVSLEEIERAMFDVRGMM